MDRTKCEHRKLTELAIITMGQSPDSVSYNNVGDGLPFFQGNADFGALYPTVRVFCNKPTREANKDDVLMSVRAPIGAVNISNIHCCIGRGLCSISPISGLSISKYLYYCLKPINM
ncbi:MAG: restriction endonuclease subunit S [Prevotella sp.]|nr:restriction endonuclease subunit S [Prevotella sp.]